jgi:transcriptional regulator of acetoin/glycerol metabolism
VQSDLVVRTVQEGIHHAISETEQTWERFVRFRGHDPGEGRGVVMDSWKRCRSLDMAPEVSAARKLVKESVVEDLWANHLLHENLVPYIHSLTDTMMPSRHLVVFTDADGLILKVTGESAIRQAAEKMNFVPGSNWREDQAGTNAIGTCLFLGAPVQIFAAEHFCAPVHPWTCSAAPITDPATHQVLGVIDLTGFREYHHPHSLAVVQSIARAIEDRLRDTLELERFAIFGEYLELAARYPDTLLIALDRGAQVIRCSSSIWDHGWIDEQNQLRLLPDGYAHKEDGTTWEVESPNGRYKWILHHCYRHHQRVGTIIQAVPVFALGGRFKPQQAYSKSHDKEDTPMSLASFSSLIGKAPKFLEAVNQARSVARHDSPVLLLGETGTGKELMAQAIHSASHRAAGAFIAVNCGAFPHELIGSELFGFEGGSFTGAAKEGRAGKFEAADGGTIFLDEIGELPLSLQPYLLRVLDTGEITRIGSHFSRHLELRIIAATNQNLETMVDKGTFRRDLFYRLNVVPIILPPVRERPGDAIRILEYFLKRSAQKTGLPVPAISPAVAVVIENYPWKGNVREIRNVSERIMAARPSNGVVSLHDLPESFHDVVAHVRQSSLSDAGLRKQEMDWILHVLDECNGNISLAAKRLGIHRSTLYRKLGKRQKP